MKILNYLFKKSNISKIDKLIPSPDSSFILNLKNKYRHLPRETFYNGISYNMDGLYCHAVPGTIETILTIINKLRVKSKFLHNLAGGTGQVPKMLTELGYKVTNVDIESSADKNHLQFDLNNSADLPLNTKFDVVLCQEVIEHIENPWLLIRRSKKALKKNGILIISTPNILSNMSKRIFTETNYFHWFNEGSFHYHINPLPYWEIVNILKINNFKLINITGSGEYYFDQAKNLCEILQYNEGVIITAKRVK